MNYNWDQLGWFIALMVMSLPPYWPCDTRRKSERSKSRKVTAWNWMEPRAPVDWFDWYSSHGMKSRVDQFIRMMRRLPYESHEFIEFRERVEVLKQNCREGANTSALNLTKPLRANVPARKWCTTKSSLDSSCVFHLLGLLVLRLHHAMMYDINSTVSFWTLQTFQSTSFHPCFPPFPTGQKRHAKKSQGRRRGEKKDRKNSRRRDSPKFQRGCWIVRFVACGCLWSA